MVVLRVSLAGEFSRFGKFPIHPKNPTQFFFDRSHLELGGGETLGFDGALLWGIRNHCTSRVYTAQSTLKARMSNQSIFPLIEVPHTFQESSCEARGGWVKWGELSCAEMRAAEPERPRPEVPLERIPPRIGEPGRPDTRGREDRGKRRVRPTAPWSLRRTVSHRSPAVVVVVVFHHTDDLKWVDFKVSCAHPPVTKVPTRGLVVRRTFVLNHEPRR